MKTQPRKACTVADYLAKKYGGSSSKHMQTAWNIVKLDYTKTQPSLACTVGGYLAEKYGGSSYKHMQTAWDIVEMIIEWNDKE